MPYSRVMLCAGPVIGPLSVLTPMGTRGPRPFVLGTVAVTVAVGELVGVAVALGLPVGVAVAVSVGVAEVLGTAVTVAVGELVGVAVGVTVGVTVGVAVGVGLGLRPTAGIKTVWTLLFWSRSGSLRNIDTGAVNGSAGAFGTVTLTIPLWLPVPGMKSGHE